MANAALKVAGAKTSGSQRLARHAAELTAQAGALLSVPDVVWKSLPKGRELSEKLGLALIDLRHAEIAYYGCIALKLNILVRRQALERNVWDFLATARALMRGRSMGEAWASKAAALPRSFAEQWCALEALCEQLRVNPGYQHLASRFTITRATSLLNEAQSLESEVANARAEWRHAAGKLHRSTAALRGEMENVRATLWNALTRRDPRFVMGLNGLGQGSPQFCIQQTPPARAEARTVRPRRSHSPVAAPRSRSTSPLKNLSVWSAALLLQPPH